jgi:ABC-type transporter Mla subunit MlaD
MDKRKRNLATVGLLTLVASVIFVWGLFWMLGTPLLRGGMDVSVLLSNGGGLKRSDRVELQGVQVGTVSQVRLSPEGGVYVQLRLDDKLALSTDTRATVVGDVFGAHTVQLIPGQSLLKLGAGDTIRGGATPQLSQIDGPEFPRRVGAHQCRRTALAEGRTGCTRDGVRSARQCGAVARGVH